MTKLHLIYIPGIGDARPGGAQRKAVSVWRWYGVDTEVFEMNWADQVPWQAKFQKLLSRIDELHTAGKTVALVSVSAGASAAINAYAARPDVIHGVVCIAGKVNRPQAIGRYYRQHQPSFVESAYASPLALEKLSPQERQRILSRYALLDTTVVRADSRVLGAHNRLVPTIGHILTIATQITLGAPSFIRFLKRLPANIK